MLYLKKTKSPEDDTEVMEMYNVSQLCRLLNSARDGGNVSFYMFDNEYPINDFAVLGDIFDFDLSEPIIFG